MKPALCSVPKLLVFLVILVIRISTSDAVRFVDTTGEDFNDDSKTQHQIFNNNEDYIATTNTSLRATKRRQERNLKPKYEVGEMKEETKGDNNAETRIVGGVESSVGQFPYFVHLFPNTGCGASLISPRVVLSAAHCDPEGFNFIGSTVAVRRYSNNEPSSNVGDNVGGLSVTVTDQVNHPQYSTNTQANDLMLLLLSVPVDIPEPTLTISTDTNYYSPPEDLDLTVMGLGRLESGGAAPDFLRHVVLPAINPDTCTELYTINGDQTFDGDIMMCAGDTIQGGIDSCQGDSGGPIVDASSDRQHVQYGVVSFGIGCGDSRFPGVYAKTGGNIDWIRNVVCDQWQVEADFCPADFATEAPTRAPTQRCTNQLPILIDWRFHTDGFGTETSWDLRDRDGFKIDGFGGSENTYDDNTPYRFQLCVECDTTFTLNLYDEFLDGFCCGGDPSYNLIVNGNVIADVKVGDPEINFGESRSWEISTMNACDATSSPTKAPILQPQPTQRPTSSPTPVPDTISPTSLPSIDLTSEQPSWSPTMSPSAPIPTPPPSPEPTPEPSSTEPAMNPSQGPSIVSSWEPTVIPSQSPSVETSSEPTMIPSQGPSIEFSSEPTMTPSQGPSVESSSEPTMTPSYGPSIESSLEPTMTPSQGPSEESSLEPSTQTPGTSSPPTNLADTRAPVFTSSPTSMYPTTTQFPGTQAPSITLAPVTTSLPTRTAPGTGTPTSTTASPTDVTPPPPQVTSMPSSTTSLDPSDGKSITVGEMNGDGISWTWTLLSGPCLSNGNGINAFETPTVVAFTAKSNQRYTYLLTVDFGEFNITQDYDLGPNGSTTFPYIYQHPGVFTPQFTTIVLDTERGESITFNNTPWRIMDDGSCVPGLTSSPTTFEPSASPSDFPQVPFSEGPVGFPATDSPSSTGTFTDTPSTSQPSSVEESENWPTKTLPPNSTPAPQPIITQASVDASPPPSVEAEEPDEKNSKALAYGLSLGALLVGGSMFLAFTYGFLADPKPTPKATSDPGSDTSTSEEQLNNESSEEDGRWEGKNE